MGTPIELEFAGDVAPRQPLHFDVLQVRPIAERSDAETVRIVEEDLHNPILTARMALGNGRYEDIHDVVYVKPESFDPACTLAIAEALDVINERLRAQRQPYILIGPGRWGSSDPWLGVPVKWANISHAKVIVEASLPGFRVDASQGTHFFQNLTALRRAYLTVDASSNEGSLDAAFLDACPATHEDAFLRHVHFDKALLVKVDGRVGDGRIKAVVRVGEKDRTDED